MARVVSAHGDYFHLICNEKETGEALARTALEQAPLERVVWLTVRAADELGVDNIIAKRNQILKLNVPGMFENTWMTTGEYMPPQIEFFRYRGRDFAQVRGLWEVENDYMGGPFVSHSFYSPDGA